MTIPRSRGGQNNGSAIIVIVVPTENTEVGGEIGKVKSPPGNANAALNSKTAVRSAWDAGRKRLAAGERLQPDESSFFESLTTIRRTIHEHKYIMTLSWRSNRLTILTSRLINNQPVDRSRAEQF
jgi:hypothetical protein